MADLPEFKIDTRGGKSLGSGIIGGLVGGAVTKGITGRAEKKKAAAEEESKKRLISHMASETKGLMTHATEQTNLAASHKTNENVRMMNAAAEHGPLRKAKMGDTSFEWQKRNDNQNTGEVTRSDTQTRTNVDPNTVPKPIEPGAQHGGKATGRVIGEKLKDWGAVPGQMTMFDKGGRVSRGVASKPSKSPTQGSLF